MLLGLAGSLLKTLGKRNSKKNAQNMVGGGTDNSNSDQSNDQSNGEDIPRKYIIVADIRPLEDIRDNMKGSSKKSKDPLNLALDGIDNALFGIIDTLGNIEKKKLDMADESTKAQQDKKKTLRERFLESGVVKSVVGSVKGAVGSTWDKITQFFIWTLVGAIVNAIVKNWDEIQKEIQKLVDDLKDLWDSPIMKIFRDFGMWIMTEGLELTKKIDPKDIDKMKEDTDKLKKELDDIESKFKEIDKKIKSGSNNELELTSKDKEDIEKEEELEAFLNNQIKDDDQNNSDRLISSETFSDSDGPVTIDGVEYKSIQEFNQLTYYVDQDGFVRKKDDNSRSLGLMSISKEGLEKRIYDKETNTSKLISESNMQSSIFNLDNKESVFNLRDSAFNSSSILNLSNKDSAFNTSSFIGKDIESRAYDLKSISTYDYAFNEDFSESINIFITGEEGSSSFSQVSPFIFSPSGGEDSFTIDEAQLLKLYKE